MKTSWMANFSIQGLFQALLDYFGCTSLVLKRTLQGDHLMVTTHLEQVRVLYGEPLSTTEAFVVRHRSPQGLASLQSLASLTLQASSPFACRKKVSLKASCAT